MRGLEPGEGVEGLRVSLFVETWVPELLTRTLCRNFRIFGVLGMMLGVGLRGACGRLQYFEVGFEVCLVICKEILFFAFMDYSLGC